MTLSHIVAMAKNGVIGTRNSLPWEIPEDMKFFREKTKGHIMIMGRKTFDSFGGKPLPKRLHIVITRTPEKNQVQNHSAETPAVIFVATISAALEEAKKHTAQFGEEVFVIGGGEIYKQTQALVDRIYLTEIDKVFDGDTFYPAVPLRDFKLCEKVDRIEPVPFSFLTFERKK